MDKKKKKKMKKMKMLRNPKEVPHDTVVLFQAQLESANF